MSPLDLNEDRDVRVKAMLLGHVRLGVYKSPHPSQTDTFVFTSKDRVRLEPIAQDFGGEIRPYKPQGAGGDTWRLISDTDAFTALFPFGDVDQNMTQDWMLWGHGGLKRRCDGFSCAVLTYDEETDEVTEEESACICRAREPNGRERECAPETRLRLLLPQTGLGIWELTTHSKIAALDLFDQVQFIASIAGGHMNHLPIRVVYGPREIRYVDAKDGKRKSTTKRIVGLSVAGDAHRALSALAAPANRALISAVEAALADSGRELAGISAAELEAGEEPEQDLNAEAADSGEDGSGTSSPTAEGQLQIGKAQPCAHEEWEPVRGRKGLERCKACGIGRKAS